MPAQLVLVILAVDDVARASPRAPRPWGDDAAYYADPDGNVVVIATGSSA